MSGSSISPSQPSPDVHPAPSCAMVRAALETSDDDATDADRLSRLTAHLVDCPPCRAFDNQRRAVRQLLLAQSSVDRAPWNLRARVAHLLSRTR